MKWFLGIALLLGIALVIKSGLLAYAAYVLLGLLVVSRFLARSWIGGLSAARKCSQHVGEIGDIVAVTVTVRNRGWLPVPWVLLEDMLPRGALAVNHPRLTVKGKRLQISTIFSKGKKTLRYKLRLKMRGYYQVGPLVMESGDLFGLHRRHRVADEPQFVLVYPRVVPLEGYDLASPRPIGEVRLTHRLYEDPTRVAGVREYQAGDPFNRVHWRATSRTGQLHSKVYEPTTIAGATLLLDFHRAGYPERGEPYRSELAVTAVASLAHALYLMGQQTGFITNGRDAADRARSDPLKLDYRTRTAALHSTAMDEHSGRLAPLAVDTRRGVEQFERIREVLARVELTDGLSFGQLVVEVAGRLPRDATVVAVLPDAPPPTALALGNLRRNGFAVTAVLIRLDDEALARAHGRLLAEGVSDVRHLRDEAELPGFCNQQVRHAAPYQVVTEYD